MRFDAESTGYDSYQKSLKASAVFLAADYLSHPFGTIWTVQLAISDQPATFANTFKKVRKGGGFYAGFGVQAATSVPGTFLYFEGRKLSISLFGDNYFGQSMQGVLGIACGTALWAPASRVTTLQQASKNSGIDNAFNRLALPNQLKSIWKAEGIRGFYRGALPGTLSAAATDAIGSLIQAQIVKRYPIDQQKNFSIQLLATWIGYSIATFFLSPIDVCVARTRIAETDPVNFPDKHFFSAMKTVYRTKATRGFFVGLPAGIIHAKLSNLNLPYVESTSLKKNHE